MTRGIMGTITLAAALVLAACSSETEGPEGADPSPATAEETGESAAESASSADAGQTTEDDQDEEAQEEAQDEEAQTGTPSDDASATESTDDASATTGSSDEAAGGDVIEVGEGAAFLTPDANIVCVLSEEGEGEAGCDIWASQEPIDVIEEAGCTDAQRPLVVLSGGTVSGDCSDELVSVEADVNAGGDWVGDGPTIDTGTATAAILEDGQTLRGATHECTVAGEDTVTCQDVAGEHGFTLSMSRYETW